MFWIAANLIRGRVGRALVAIRDHPIAAETMGVDAAFYKTTCFGISALYAGVAGGLDAIAVGFVSPESFGLALSLAFLVGIVIGGLASISGVLFGALFIEFVPNYADQLTVYFGENAKALPGAVYGVMMILMMAVGADGDRRPHPVNVARRARDKRRGLDDGSTPVSDFRRRLGARAPTALGAADMRRASRATEIKIGQTMPYSGPASAYGVIGRTETAYFKMLNEQGGVNGRKINLISLDDGYSPPKTVEQVRRLVEQEKVAFLFQCLGTPCNMAIRQYCNDNKVPQIFCASGSSALDDPKHFPWTSPANPIYQNEARILAKYILQEKPNARIGVLYQNDGLGKDYLIGIKDVLGPSHADMIVKEASYEVSEPTVDSQVTSLQGSGADVLVIAATPKFAAQAIRKSADLGWSGMRIVSNVSVSVATVMKPAGLEKAKGVLGAQWGKEPTDARWKDDPGMTQWREFADKYMTHADFLDVNASYGFGNAITMTHILKQCGDDLSRENILQQATHLNDLESPLLLPGMRLTTKPGSYSAVRQMRMSVFDGSTWQLIGGLIEA